MKWNIDHVQLAGPPQCEPVARAYYANLLGLQEIPKLGETRKSGGLWFQANNIEIHIGIEKNFLPAKKAHIALCGSSIEQITRLANLLQNQQYPVRWDHKIPSIKRFFTEDPFGNRIEILTKTF